MGERSVGGTSEQLVERKVRGGKLFRIRIWREGDVAVGVSLTGDRQADINLVCPCNFKVQRTWKENGECWCGLFVKKVKA